MADVRDPLRQLIDVAVYAPIGLILLARKELPNLVASGRSRVDNQITLARFIGKLALKRGSQELKRRLDAAEAARNASTPFVDAQSVEVAGASASAGFDVDLDVDVEVEVELDVDPASRGPVAHGDRKVRHSAQTMPEVIVSAVAQTAELAEDPAPQPGAALPIDGYDSLAASQVVVRLGTLTTDELDTIRRHEESHRARRTIIGKISQLQAR